MIAKQQVRDIGSVALYLLSSLVMLCFLITFILVIRRLSSNEDECKYSKDDMCDVALLSYIHGQKDYAENVIRVVCKPDGTYYNHILVFIMIF